MSSPTRTRGERWAAWNTPRADLATREEQIAIASKTQKPPRAGVRGVVPVQAGPELNALKPVTGGAPALLGPVQIRELATELGCGPQKRSPELRARRQHRPADRGGFGYRS